MRKLAVFLVVLLSFILSGVAVAAHFQYFAEDPAEQGITPPPIKFNYTYRWWMGWPNLTLPWFDRTLPADPSFTTDIEAALDSWVGQPSRETPPARSAVQ